MGPVEDSNPFVEFAERYRDDRVLFVREMWGVEPFPWQAETMGALDRGERRVSVRSGHGVGKSCLDAWVMIHYILTRFPVKIGVTAPSGPQLFDALFPEIKHWISELPEAMRSLLNVKAESIELAAAPDSAFISAKTARSEQPEAMQGMHAPYMMFVADEASGIPDAVFESSMGVMTTENAVMLLTGNPNRGSGFFYQTQTALPGWWVRRVSCYDSPNTSGTKYIEEMRETYGAESNAFRIRVLGEFPLADDNTVIPWDLVESAAQREGVVPNPMAKVFWGLDVARFGDNFSALVKRKQNVVFEPKMWRGLELMQLCGAVMDEWNSTAFDERPVEILVDAIGVGAGVADRLRELKLPARSINTSEQPGVSKQKSTGHVYANLRVELWYKARDWLEKRDCKIPNHQKLKTELTACRYDYQDSNGKLKIESKKEMRNRGAPSPDIADAFCLTFASDAGTALYGTSYASDWNKAISRDVAVV